MLPEHSRGIEIIRIPPEMPQKPSGIIHSHWIHDISKSKTVFFSLKKNRFRNIIWAEIRSWIAIWPDSIIIRSIRSLGIILFSDGDIFVAIQSYELLLHTHSAHMLKRSFLGPKSEKHISERDSAYLKNKLRFWTPICKLCEPKIRSQTESLELQASSCFVASVPILAKTRVPTPPSNTPSLFRGGGGSQIHDL